MDKIPHIFDYMQKDDFDFSEVGTMFHAGTLVVYYQDRYITIEDFLSIVRDGGTVTFSEFKGRI